ncbi:hypothetical protein SK128_009081 [Halocaridina rubra]|uniref:Uncharacterized protein n=1 Tax=Halocaridina rubra TaxID=373956 RepID=A0AAN8XBK5_HALRR
MGIRQPGQAPTPHCGGQPQQFLPVNSLNSRSWTGTDLSTSIMRFNNKVTDDHGCNSTFRFLMGLIDHNPK